MEPNKTTQRNIDRSLEAQALTSKIQTLSNQLKVLLQKKIRLDIEIRRTKRTLSKLKSNSSSLLKISAAVEQEVPQQYTPFIRDLLSSLEQAHFNEARSDLKDSIAEADEVLRATDALEGYLVPEESSL